MHTNKIVDLAIKNKILNHLLGIIANILGKLVFAFLLIGDWVTKARQKETFHLNKVYLIDGCHGGIPLWDWILLQNGGLWDKYFWPVVVQTMTRRARTASVQSVMEIDGYTISEMAHTHKKDLIVLGSLLEKHLIELVNGTYSQPFLQTISGESCIRQFYEGLSSISQSTQFKVTAYASQEPGFCSQLPQLLKGFGYQGILLRTHWAAFGTEPSYDLDAFYWCGPDNSQIPTIPRYSFLPYSRLLGDPNHPGILSGGLSYTTSGKFDLQEMKEFSKDAISTKIQNPVYSQFVDVFEAPTPYSKLLATNPITLSNYLNLVDKNSLQNIKIRQDELLNTFPWGLESDALTRKRSYAEKQLIAAEMVDAIHWWYSGETHEEKIKEGWRKLLLAQHHDLQVCGTWLSVKHGTPLSSIGIQLCEQAANIGINILNNQVVVNNSDKADSQDTLTVNVNDDGTFTVLNSGQTLLEDGGYLSVWSNDIFYDSRKEIHSINQLNKSHWEVVGQVGLISFKENIQVRTNFVEINLELDFSEVYSFGPQKPDYGYYVDDEKKLIFSITVGSKNIIRDTPFYFERTELEHFNSLSWVGIEDSNGINFAVLLNEPAGFSYNRERGVLSRVLAWSPKGWLYDSDDSITRNGTKFTRVSGVHTITIFIMPYKSRSIVAKTAYENPLPRLIFPNIYPEEIVLTAMFIHEEKLYVRLWNPSEKMVHPKINFDSPVEILKVNYLLENEDEQMDSVIMLKPWQVQTFLIKKAP